jgi:PucR family transcriptional regulator, purine catabolism regulatory protein
MEGLVSLTVREVLALGAMREAAPEVLSGAGGLDNRVRWVHSSEIFEMGPLLTGRELLLTTGLGIVGADAGTRRHYLRELIARDLACLAFEVGRSFRDVPYELVDEAQRHELPLVALRRVVPFIRISEEANSAIVSRDLRRLSIESEVTRLLDGALAAESGVTDILSVVSSTYGVPLALVAASGALVATAGIEPNGLARDSLDPSLTIDVSVHGHPWGRLCANSAPPDMAKSDLIAIMERTGVAIGLTLLATGRSSSDAERQAAGLLSDLLETVVVQRTDFAIRSNLAGFHPPSDARFLGVAVDAPEVGPALAVLTRTARQLGTYALRGMVRGDVVGLLAVPAGTESASEVVDATLRETIASLGASLVLAVLGPVVAADPAPADLAASLRQAVDVLHLLRAKPQFGSEPRPTVVASQALGLELELTRHGDPSHLASLVDQVLGPLVRWDDEHGTDLVSTLETFLRLGCSATRASGALHLARGSMYDRMDRIKGLLAVDVRSPDLHSTLLLAACSHRLLK